MRRTVLYMALCLTAIICLPSLSAFAQTDAPSTSARSNSDQVLKDILNEVRQLRADILRLNVNAHRTQALLENMKIQQEQVVLLTREVGNIREELAAVRGRQARTRNAFDVKEKQKAARPVGENEFKALTAELEELKQREQNLSDR